MSVTVSDTDVPIRAVRPRGKTSARASARRSRTSWVSSLRVCAKMRRMACAPSGGDGRLLGDREEDILQGVVLLDRFEDAHAVPQEALLEPARRLPRVPIDDHVEAIAEERHPPRL